MRINHGGQPVKGESRTDPRLQVLLQLARNLGRDPGDPVVQRELAPPARPDASRPRFQPAGFYDYNDLAHLQALKPLLPSPLLQLQTMDELLARDKQREKDGFPRRIRIGRLIRPGVSLFFGRLVGIKKTHVVFLPPTGLSRRSHSLTS